MRKLSFLLLLVLMVSLVACGGESAPGGGAEQAAGGDAAAGEALFIQPAIGSQPGCTTCHSLEPGVTGVGPSLAKVGAEAASRVSGVPAGDYLRQSIIEPDAYVATGFSAGVMPKGLATELSEQQVNDLIAFMLTQK